MTWRPSPDTVTAALVDSGSAQSNQPLVADGNGGAAWGTAGALKRTVNATPSTLANLNATTETAFAGPATIAAGNLGVVGRSIRFKAFFKIDSVNGADTVRLRARLGATGVGGVVVADTTALTMAANKGVYFCGTIVILSVGAGGTFAVYTDDKVESPPTALGTFDVAGAIDTTLARDLTLTAEWSAKSANDSVTMQWFEVEVWPGP